MQRFDTLPPIIRHIWVFSLCLLTACSVVVERDGAPTRDIDVSEIEDAQPKVEKYSKYGNPDSYEGFGKRYYT